MPSHWQIGTMRPEEARIHDTWAGYHSFHAEPLAAGEPAEEYGSFEIFWRDAERLSTADIEQIEESGGDWEPDLLPAGWYWWPCFSGCMPDGEPSGPFATSRDALEDADEWHPEFDDK